MALGYTPFTKFVAKVLSCSAMRSAIISIKHRPVPHDWLCCMKWLVSKGRKSVCLRRFDAPGRRSSGNGKGVLSNYLPANPHASHTGPADSWYSTQWVHRVHWFRISRVCRYGKLPQWIIFIYQSRHNPRVPPQAVLDIPDYELGNGISNYWRYLY